MAKYDPNKQYKWEADTEFKMLGSEFGLVLNTFRTILNSPEAQRILALEKANGIIENTLARSVEEGIVNEVSSTEENPQPLEVVKDKK